MSPKPLFLLLAAVSYIWQGANDQARAFENEASAPAPVLPEIAHVGLIKAIDQALAGHRFVEAKDLLDKLEAGQDSVEDGNVKLLRAEWLIAVGRAAEARPLLNSIDHGFGQRCRVFSAELIASLQMADLDRADRLVADSEHACRYDPVYWRSLARLHLLRERPAAAIEAFRIALSLAPANDAILGELGVAQIAADQPGEAVRTLADLVKRNPDRADVQINLDYARGMSGQRPARAATDDDMFWSRRLQYAGLGARQGGHRSLAEALLGQALIERPKHDAELWRQYADVSGSI